MIKRKINLIPRYNWDYKFADFSKSFNSALGPYINKHQDVEEIFNQQPVFTTSGRTSLYAILKSLDLPESSGVAVPLYCCDVVFNAIKQANLTPIFIDINLDDYNISSSDFKKKKDTFSAVVAVHMFGHPADMDAISDVCKDTPIIEDCAQSLFSRYKGEYTGFLSTASFFSFRSGKYISSGEGSIIFSKHPILLEKLHNLINEFDEWTTFQQMLHCVYTYIKSSLYRRPLYGLIGYPIGRVLDRKLNLTAKSGFKLKKIAESDLEIIRKRLKNFSGKVNQQRNNALFFLKKIKIREIFLPQEKRNCWSNYYQFALRFNTIESRDRFADYLFKNGIDTAKYLDDIVKIAKDLYGYKGDCPNAEYCSKRVLIIPNHYTLSQEDLFYIVYCINAGAKYL